MAKTITIRINDEEEEMMNKVVKMYEGGLSSIIKKLFFEKLEDELDLKEIEEYENELKHNKVDFVPFEEVKKDLNL